jgi:hypothetical protein
MIKNVQIVTPLDASKICVSQNPSFPESYIVDLPLDSVPDSEWRDTFDLKWKSSRDLWDRKLVLVGDKVRLVTTADEFVEKLDWVEKTIDETNDAIGEQCRMIEREKGMIRDATVIQESQADTPGYEMILQILKTRFNM